MCLNTMIVPSNRKMRATKCIISFDLCLYQYYLLSCVTIVSGIDADFKTNLPRNLDYKQNVKTFFPVLVINYYWCVVHCCM